MVILQQFLIISRLYVTFCVTLFFILQQDVPDIRCRYVRGVG